MLPGTVRPGAEDRSMWLSPLLRMTFARAREELRAGAASDFRPEASGTLDRTPLDTPLPITPPMAVGSGSFPVLQIIANVLGWHGQGVVCLDRVVGMGGHRTSRSKRLKTTEPLWPCHPARSASFWLAA